MTKCPECSDTGERDSGGMYPWGESILLPCDCKDAEIGRQWRENSSLKKWFPITAERLVALEAENAALKHDLQYARDGLIRGRTRMREDNERLRAALAELLACHTESAGWSMSMLTDRAEFDAMLARSQERYEAAIGAAREALGPNAKLNGGP